MSAVTKLQTFIITISYYAIKCGLTTHQFKPCPRSLRHPHLGTDHPHNHFPECGGIRPGLSLEEKMLLLARSYFSSPEKRQTHFKNFMKSHIK